MSFTVWHIVVVSVIVAIVAAVIASVRTRRKDIRKVAYMMDALEDGELVGVGTHDELLNTCPLYRDIHFSQFGKEELT